MDELPWWKRERKQKNFTINEENTVYIGNGAYRTLPKNSFISPIKKQFLPYGHWAVGQYDETKMIYADTPVGFCFIELKYVDM